MVLGLLKNIPILNSFLGKPAASQESSGTEAAAKANEKAIAQEGLKPLFIVILPAEGDFSELKAKLKEKFNGRDLHFEVDPELKKPKLYILKPNALAKRNLETALDKAFIKNNYKSIELSEDGNKLAESLFRTMNTEFSYLKGAERKIEYTQKEAEKANSRQTLEKLSQMGVHVCSAECERTHGGKTLDSDKGDNLLEGFTPITNRNNDNETITKQVASTRSQESIARTQPVNNKGTTKQTIPQQTESLESHPDEDTSSKVENPQKKPQASTQEQGKQGSQTNTQNKKTNKPSSNPFSPQTIINQFIAIAEPLVDELIDKGQKIWNHFFGKPDQIGRAHV